MYGGEFYEENQYGAGCRFNQPRGRCYSQKDKGVDARCSFRLTQKGYEGCKHAAGVPSMKGNLRVQHHQHSWPHWPMPVPSANVISPRKEQPEIGK